MQDKPAAIVSLLRKYCVFHFNPFFEMANSQLAYEYSFHWLRSQYQFNFIYIATFQADDRTNAYDVIFIYPVKLAGIKHFIDIMQVSRHFVNIPVSNINQEAGFVFQVQIRNIPCPENKIFISSSEDHAPAIPVDCIFHDKIYIAL
jgi:hypothetical protein